ncbi:hypothetical protein LJC49_09770, partial [Ruminococcaceae bacterium OttesenSCG-928-I18]|nr:hypothetical protein [Ruminococcaceae bacterium OttesenSCG-928-I18]
VKEFDSGVGWFTKGFLPPINFPEDDVCCDRCRLFKKYEGRCSWTYEVVPRPKTNPGDECPIRKWYIPAEGQKDATD